MYLYTDCLVWKVWYGTKSYQVSTRKRNSVTFQPVTRDSVDKYSEISLQLAEVMAGESSKGEQERE